MSIRTDIDKQVAEIDARILRSQTASAAEVAALTKRRDVLVRVKRLVTDEVNQAIEDLRSIGFDIVNQNR